MTEKKPEMPEIQRGDIILVFKHGTGRLLVITTNKGEGMTSDETMLFQMLLTEYAGTLVGAIRKDMEKEISKISSPRDN